MYRTQWQSNFASTNGN